MTTLRGPSNMHGDANWSGPEREERWGCWVAVLIASVIGVSAWWAVGKGFLLLLEALL